MSGYFYKEEKSVSKDLDRHMKKERELRARLADQSLCPHARKAYEMALKALMKSKAKVVDKIGRPK